MARPRSTDDPFERPTTGRKKKDVLPDNTDEIERWRKLRHVDWAARFHKIRDNAGKLVPFNLNPIQIRCDDIFEEEMAKSGSAYLIILKARKEGVSTWVLSKQNRSNLEREGWNAGVMAHDDSGCDFLFGRAKVIADSLPDNMKRVRHKWNKKEIAYAQPHASFQRVNVAKGKGGWGRGGDFHFIHLSEVAFWESIRGQSRAQGQATSIINAMPRVNGVAVIVESTANGAGNEFHKLWLDAVAGKNGFRAVFFGWQDFPEYRLEGKKADDFPSEPEWLAEEPRLRSVGCDEAQLAWRRWKIAKDCQGDIDIFHQEYPAFPEEAFLATGTPVFQASIIQDRLRALEKRERDLATRRFSFDSKGVLEVEPHGEVRTWRNATSDPDLFKDQDRLVIIADPAGAGANAPNPQKGDPCCAKVWDRRVNEELAELHGWMEPDEFAQQLYWLGQSYRFPLLVVEAGPWGGHVIRVLRDLEYPRLYFRDRFGEQLLNTPTNFGQYGWATTNKSKPQMIDALRELWRQKRIVVNSLETCQEHLTFVKNGVKREAQAGCHDDRVMVCAIYAAWQDEHPYTAPEQPMYTRPPETWGDIIDALLSVEKPKSNWRLG